MLYPWHSSFQYVMFLHKFSECFDGSYVAYNGADTFCFEIYPQLLDCDLMLAACKERYNKHSTLMQLPTAVIGDLVRVSYM